MVKRKYQHLLESIVNSVEKQEGKFNETATLAINLLSEELVVDYVGVCILSIDANTIEQVAHSGNAIDVIRPKPRFCSQYLTDLKQHRIIDVADVNEDIRVKALFECYFYPKQINSSLDVAIRINGHLEGVLFLESSTPRSWSESELDIVAQVADQLALTLATQRAYETDERLSLFLKAIEHSEQVSMVVNLHTDIIEYVNSAYHSMSGTPKQKILGCPIYSLDFFKQSPDQAHSVLTDVKRGRIAKGDTKLTRSDGSSYWVRYSVNPFTTQRGNYYALITAEDSSDELEHKNELERLAWRCSLTGLYNRSFFNKALERRTTGHLMLIDLMGFKRFNDTYGHEKGDRLLVEVARRLRHFASINQAELVARVGSDEFAVVVDGLEDSKHLDYLIKRLYHQLTLPVTIGREAFDAKPALSIVEIDSLEEMFSALTCADIAVQYAKRKQGDAIQLFNNALLNTFKEGAQIERDLQSALKNREFELYYQPLRDLNTQRYIGAEALIRWHHPKRGVLYPAAFIDIAEQTGMIGAIGEWVLETACRQLNLWQHHNMNLSMHVNVAAQQFFNTSLYDQVWQLVTRYRIKPRTLIIEITETELMEDIIYATNLCKELAELGVGLAIDDFGTGYSSMRYLKQFPISKLKIDRSFISDLSVSHESREIVSAIIAMASALNISLTAEGVETIEQEQFLTKLRCHHAQGFLYSPALREAEFERFLKVNVQLTDTLLSVS
ncbi:putative bifunctional diguanylate cyclase/phosphodiesterase [Shewanella psychrotolerans]|uniref:putative bifunctional diguanylate cyclase/phosphodiesterase n=1 Tax=Shewanella psychrotolerans TaxID=2864206 RepID=UPI001C6557ED|nr:EAL domain-containing protein [Shewanella psychrotolerans]QYJ99908.1 EAL domain-containing protein [Shewanella psychrotolerans]